MSVSATVTGEINAAEMGSEGSEVTDPWVLGRPAADKAQAHIGRSCQRAKEASCVRRLVTREEGGLVGLVAWEGGTVGVWVLGREGG